MRRGLLSFRESAQAPERVSNTQRFLRWLQGKTAGWRLKFVVSFPEGVRPGWAQDMNRTCLPTSANRSIVTPRPVHQTPSSFLSMPPPTQTHSTCAFYVPNTSCVCLWLCLHFCQRRSFQPPPIRHSVVYEPVSLLLLLAQPSTHLPQSDQSMTSPP